ncbi:MAG: hypothetical protein ACRDJN_08075, partial [Chloroflexota bacterium]
RAAQGSGSPLPSVGEGLRVRGQPKYQAGDRVCHTTFGEGIVLESTVTRRGEEEVRVQFHDSKMRVLLGALAPMEVVQD